MRNTITVTAIAITLASGLSFAAADKADQSHSETGMMSGDKHMEMMGDMRGMRFRTIGLLQKFRHMK